MLPGINTGGGSPVANSASFKASPTMFSLPSSVYHLPESAESSTHSSRSGSLHSNAPIHDIYRALGLMETDDAKSDAEQERMVADLLGASDSPASKALSPAASLISLQAIQTGIPAPETIELELFRENFELPFKEIQPESYDWSEIATRSNSAFVVRLKTLVNEEEPKNIIDVIQSHSHGEPAIDIVAKFHELSVAEKAPKRYETRILFVYENANDYSAERFGKLMDKFLPENNFPYFTIEYLDSFLLRRQFANGDVPGEEALKLLKEHVSKQLPCSSLFLKLAAHYPDECLTELENLARVDPSMPLTHLGERSLHKLAVSIVNKMRSPEGSLKKAMNILKLGVEPRDWGYVAFNTLMRLAQEEDELMLKKSKSAVLQVDLLLNLINVSNLDLLDKVALLMMAGRTPKSIAEAPDFTEVSQALRRINNVCSDRRESKVGSVDSEDLKFTIELLSLGSTSSCHLVSTILRRCVDHSAFSSGWKIASQMISISKQVFGEVVTLCSKAYFASLKKHNAEELGDMWFRRIQWCVERHLPFLNRYPCGLALHVAAQRREFDCCWRWFCSMREQLAFRLTGYHTSAVLKAASFEDEPDMDKVRDSYGMTTAAERTTFTFIPLVRIWDTISDSQRSKSLDFWDEVSQNLKTYLDGQHDSKRAESEISFSPNQDMREAAEMNGSTSDAQLEQVIFKLNHWYDVFFQWKKLTSNGTDFSKLPAAGSSRRSSHKSSGSGSHRGSGRKNDRRSSKQHRGSAGRAFGDNYNASSPQFASGSGSFAHRRFSETSGLASSPAGAGVPSISTSAFPIPSSKYTPDDSSSIRRWSGNSDPAVIQKAVKNSGGHRVSDRRSSERGSGTSGVRLGPISRPGSGNTATLASLESSPNSRGSSTSASPNSSRNGSVQYGLSPLGTNLPVKRS